MLADGCSASIHIHLLVYNGPVAAVPCPALSAALCRGGARGVSTTHSTVMLFVVTRVASS
jgi:hypothetical protein